MLILKLERAIAIMNKVVRTVVAVLGILLITVSPAGADGGDRSALTVVSITPTDGATNVALTSPVTVRFSHPVDALTIDGISIMLTDGDSQVQCMITMLHDGKTIVVHPAVPLNRNTAYEVIIASAVTSKSGQPLAADQPDGSFTATFQTIDVTRPAHP